jgi:peptide deformylase
MAIYKLINSDNSILRVSLSGVSEDCDRKKLQEDLIETMKNFKGLGLSANQCGIMERVFVMYSDFEKREATACFNPKILDYSKEEVIMDEGCLSYPGLWLKVKRAHNILVEFEDIKGDKKEIPLKDVASRVFQHEMDHMDGTDFTQKVSKLRLDMATRRMLKQRKKGNRLMGFHDSKVA